MNETETILTAAFGPRGDGSGWSQSGWRPDGPGEFVVPAGFGAFVRIGADADGWAVRAVGRRVRGADVARFGPAADPGAFAAAVAFARGVRFGILAIG